MAMIINNKVINVPKDAQDGSICPYRDWFQTECWACDYCGRNEDYEHGADFPTINIGGFRFFKESIKEGKLKDNVFRFKYGNKTILIDIKYIDDDYCGYELQEIWDKIEELKEKGTVEDMYYDYKTGQTDTVIQYQSTTQFVLKDCTLTFEKLSDEHAVLAMITSQIPDEMEYNSFLGLINYLDQEKMTEGEWEDIYGWDI